MLEQPIEDRAAAEAPGLRNAGHVSIAWPELSTGTVMDSRASDRGRDSSGPAGVAAGPPRLNTAAELLPACRARLGQ